MNFLVDANLPRSVVALLAQFGHSAEFVRDTGLADASDVQIAARARAVGAVLLARDVDFADIRHHPPDQYQGILVLRLDEDNNVAGIVSLLQRFLKQPELISQMPGHLVILEPFHVRFRPPLG